MIKLTIKSNVSQRFVLFLFQALSGPGVSCCAVLETLISFLKQIFRKLHWKTTSLVFVQFPQACQQVNMLTILLLKDAWLTGKY